MRTISSVKCEVIQQYGAAFGYEIGKRAYSEWNDSLR